MPNFVSPGAYVIEKDISDYPPTINSSVVGIVGFASRGPIAGLNNEKATLITSQQQLIDTFGEPAEYIKGQALEGSLEILEATNSMRFVRCASGGAEASAAVTIGGCPSFSVSGTHAAPLMAAEEVGLNGGMSAIGSLDDATSSVRLAVDVYDNNGTMIVNKVFIIPAGTISASASEGATSRMGLDRIIGGSLDADRVSVQQGGAGEGYNYIVGAAAGAGASISGTMAILDDQGRWRETQGLRPTSRTGGFGTTASSTQGSGVTINTSAAAYLAKSLWPGEGYNAGAKTDGSTSGVSFEVGVNGADTTFETINNLGTAAESAKAGFVSGSFLPDVIGTTYATRTSNYLTAYFVSGGWQSATSHEEVPGDTLSLTALDNWSSKWSITAGGATSGFDSTIGADGSVVVDPRFVKLVQGTFNLSGGTNGIPNSTTHGAAGEAAGVATAVVGEVRTDGGKTGMEALDDPVLNISVALAPGPGVGDNQTVQNGLVTVAERTTDFLALLSPPYAVGTAGDAIDWSNGFTDTRTAAINSSYCAIYWPWVKVFQVFDGKDRWLAPEIYGARQMGVTDNVSDPWFAPAGFVRGRLTKPTDVEVIVNQGDRDSMYSGGNVINPLCNFPQRGIAIFGQRTAQREPTALDRINIRRMMIYIKKQLLASTQRLVFEPNDQFTWQRVEQLVNPMLDDIARRRGITEYKVICDETTNTPVRIDRNEMWCKVLIKPTKTAEIVIFELNLTNQSANFGTL
jgi:phage tail sheath protein FI